jgi:amino acid adenylation domain-containing protein
MSIDALKHSETGLLGMLNYQLETPNIHSFRRQESEASIEKPGVLAEAPQICHLPVEECVHELFEKQVLRTPNARAVVAEGAHITYAQLNQRANRLAHYLRGIGVNPGVLVGIHMERCVEMIVAVLGVLKAGGAYVPLDPTYPRDRTRYMVEHAGIRVLVTRGSLADFLVQPEIRVVAVDTMQSEITRQPDTNPASGVRPEDRIYAIYTSGSTGHPKLSGVHHRGFANLLNWFTGEFRIAADDRVLLVSSFNFDLTQKNIYAPLITGGELHLQTSSSYEPELIRSSVQTNRITLINWTPNAFYPLLNGGDAGFEQLRSLRLVFLGGEAISLPALRAWVSSRHFHAVFANTYGPTECTDICAFHRFGREEVLNESTVPVGRPIWNADVYVLGKELEVLPAGTTGELCIGGIGVGEGYINNPALTVEKFLPDPFSPRSGARMYKTGDLACRFPDGNIQFRGRADNQVKVNGFRIELEEIERALAEHPAICQAAVRAWDSGDADSNRQLTAYVVPGTVQGPQSHELREFLSCTLPEYMIPSAFVRLTALPLTSNRKLDRAALPPPSTENALDTICYQAPETAIEIQVAAILSQLLVIERVGRNDNFFLLGGHSLLSAQLVVRLRERFGVRLTLRDLFETQTLTKLAERVESQLISNLEQMSEEEAQGILSTLEHA